MFSESPNTGGADPIIPVNTYTWFVPRGTAQLKDGLRSNLAFPRGGLHTFQEATVSLKKENNNYFFSCDVEAMRTKPCGVLWPCEA